MVRNWCKQMEKVMVIECMQWIRPQCLNDVYIDIDDSDDSRNVMQLMLDTKFLLINVFFPIVGRKYTLEKMLTNQLVGFLMVFG